MTEPAQQNVLIVSDDSDAVRPLLQALAARGIHGTVVREAGAAGEKARSGDWGLLAVDVEAVAPQRLCGLLEAAKADSPEMPVIVLSGPDGVEAAVAAVRTGCDDVLVKPLVVEHVDALLAGLLPNHPVPMAAAARRGARVLYQMAGESPRLLRLTAMARKVAPTSVPVLISGPSGTGKELIAYLIHHESNRSRGPYVRVNCAGLSESLLESELFGHEKGAFTGAHIERKGRFELAHGGTLLLDEISETGPRLQAELLRVLETQDFERVGGSEPIRVNVRIVTTTNRDLAAEVERGGFRADLYYRLNGLHLEVPALRDRLEDLPVLIWHFVNQFARESPRRIETLAPEMLRRFSGYDWPGNVRQLRNVVRAALLFGDGPVLGLDDLPDVPERLMMPRRRPGGGTLRLQELERQAVLEALRRTDSHYAKAAELLGISDRTLREKLRRYRRDGHLTEKGQWVRETA